MKKDLFFVSVQFILFVSYLLNWGLLSIEPIPLLQYAASFGVVLGIIIIIFGILNLSDNLSPFPAPKNNSAQIDPEPQNFFSGAKKSV